MSTAKHAIDSDLEKSREELLEELQALREFQESALLVEAQRSNVEDRLKEFEHLCRSLVDSSMDMIIAVNANREVMIFNQAAQEGLGYTLEEISNQPISVVYASEEDRALVQTAVQENGSFSGEIKNRRKNGEVFPAYLSAAEILDDDGVFMGFMGISRDITDRKAAEEALRRAHDELEERVKQRTIELSEANELLRREIEQRKKSEADRELLHRKLENALSKALSGFIPICARCKNIRRDDGNWTQIERYLQDRTEAEFTHGICKKCAESLYAEDVD